MEVERIRWLFVTSTVFLMILLQGCSSTCKHESDVSVQTLFTKDKSVHIIVSTKPDEITDSTLDSIQSFFKDSLELQTKVTKVGLGIPSNSDITTEELFDASTQLLKRAKQPTLVIITVESVKDFGGYGMMIPAETSYENGEKYPVAVVILTRKKILSKNFEWQILKHEVGHWVGVPARECHVYKDGSHCSNLRCVMTNGPGSNLPRWLCGVGLSVVFLGPPDFCNDCKRELLEMKKLHSQTSQD